MGKSKKPPQVVTKEHIKLVIPLVNMVSKSKEEEFFEEIEFFGTNYQIGWKDMQMSRNVDGRYKFKPPFFFVRTRKWSVSFHRYDYQVLGFHGDFVRFEKDLVMLKLMGMSDGD